MTNQKYQIGDKVLVEMEIVRIIPHTDTDISYNLDSTDKNIYNTGIFSIWAKARHFRPYTPKPEFEYGEEIEYCISPYGGHPFDEWCNGFFIAEVNNRDPYKFIVFTDGSIGLPIQVQAIRKLQPKKELIEINGKKYDAEKVKERLADLKAEE